MNYGPPIPLGKKIEVTEFFNQEALGRMLIKHVADSRLPSGLYGGHVSLSVHDGHYSVTVYVWKETQEEKPQAA